MNRLLVEREEFLQVFFYSMLIGEVDELGNQLLENQ